MIFRNLSTKVFFKQEYKSMSTIIIMKKGLLKTRQSKNTKMKVQVKRSDSPNKLQKKNKNKKLS